MDRRARATLAAVLLALAGSAALVIGAPTTRAWIDQPLPGATLPFAPASVDIHAASDTGIDRIAVLVDGLPAPDVDAPAGDLVHVAWTWSPPSPGEHLLTIIAWANGGVPSAPVSVAVTFVGRDGVAPTTPPSSPTASGLESPGAGQSPGASQSPGAGQSPGGTRPPGPSAAPTPGSSSPPGSTPKPTATPKPSQPGPTPSPRVTPAPTQPPCEPQGPTLLSPEYDAAINESQPDLEWSYDGRCLVSEWHVEVSLSNTFNDLVAMGVVPGGQDYWSVDVVLEACVNHWWRVSGIGEESGEPGEPSATYLFHVIGRSCA
jgi:hypothetical protein